MRNCLYCQSILTSNLKKKFCNNDCCYKFKLQKLDTLKKPIVKIKKVYSDTHFDWRDYPYGVIV